MKKGYILLPVLVALWAILWTCVQLVSKIYGAENRVQMEWNRIQITQAVRSATECARFMIEHPEMELNLLGRDGKTGIELQRFVMNEKPLEIKIGSIGIQMSIMDEQARINIGRLLFPSLEPDSRMLAIVSRRLDLDDEKERKLVRFLADWTQRNHCNLPIPGILMESGGVTEEEAINDLTVEGNGLININTAPETVLRCLVENNGYEFASHVEEARRSIPFKSVAEIRDLPGLKPVDYASVFPLLTTTTSTFRVRIRALSGECVLASETIVSKIASGSVVLHSNEWWE